MRHRPALKTLPAVVFLTAVVAACLLFAYTRHVYRSYAESYEFVGFVASNETFADPSPVILLLNSKGIYPNVDCSLVCSVMVKRNDELCAVSILEDAKRRGQLDTFYFKHDRDNWGRSGMTFHE